jgi:hypothetical protein
MNIVKRMFALLLIFVFIFGIMNVNTFSAGSGVKVIISDVIINSNGEGTVDISIENNPGITYIKLTIDFDNSYLTPVSFKSENSSFTAISSIDQADAELDEMSKITIIWDSAQNINSDGVIGKLTFKAKDGVFGSTSVIGTADEVYNQDLEDVEAIVVSGEVTINNPYLIGDVNYDGSITKEDGAIILRKSIMGDKFEMPIESKVVDYTKYADLNGDNQITIIDAILTLEEAE